MMKTPSPLDRRRLLGSLRRLRTLALLVVAIALIARVSAAAEIPADALRTVTRATVLIEAIYKAYDPVNPEDQFPAWGTGFIVADEGLIVTNAHVVDAFAVIDISNGRKATSESDPANRKIYRLDSVTVRTNSGQKESRVYPGQVLCTQALPTDLALVRIRASEKLTAVPLASAAEFGQLKPLDPVWAIGFPLGRQIEFGLSAAGLGENPHGADISIRNGQVTSLRRDSQGVKALEHNCNIEHGNSGGPLVDARGRVVGVNYLGLGERSMFAIPTTRVLQVFARTLRDRAGIGGRKRQPKIINVTNVDELYAATAAAGPGDTIAVAAGTYALRAGATEPKLPIQRGVWLRGAGIGQTTFVLSDPLGGLLMGETAWGPDGAELSDLTIIREATGAEAVDPAVVTLGNEEVFVHDVTIETRAAKGACIRVFNNAVVFNCTFRVNVKAPDRFETLAAEVLEGRFERVRLPSLQVTPGLGRILIRGCEFTPSDKPRLMVTGTASPSVEGCLFDGPAGDLQLIPVLRHDGRSLGSYSDNLFWIYSVTCGLQIVHPQSVSFRWNRFEWRGPRFEDVRVGEAPPYKYFPVTVLHFLGSAKDFKLEHNAFFGCNAVHLADDRSSTGPVISNGNGNRYIDDYKVRSN